MTTSEHDIQRYPLRTKASHAWWDRSRDRPQSGYPPSQVLCPEYYGGEIWNAIALHDAENTPRGEKLSDGPSLTSITDKTEAHSELQAICSPDAEAMDTGPNQTRSTTNLSKAVQQRSPSVTSNSNTSRPASLSSVADSEISVPNTPENEIEHRINRMLRSPVTSTSDHLRGPDGKPLGIEVAINAYHKGEYSTGYLDRGCLPSGLQSRTAELLTSRYYGDHETAFSEGELDVGLDPSKTVITSETVSVAVHDKATDDGAARTDHVMKKQSCEVRDAYLALRGGDIVMTENDTLTHNQNPVQTESLSGVSRLRIPENRHLRPVYKFARPSKLLPRHLSKEYNIVQNPFVEGTKSARPFLIQLGKMMLPISPVELAEIEVPSHQSHHRSRSTPSQAHIHPLLRIPTESPAKTYLLKRSVSDASPQRYLQAALGAPNIGSQPRYVFENDFEEDRDPHKAEAITRHVSSMSSSVSDFPSAFFHSPSPSLSTFPSSISGSPYRHHSVLQQQSRSETLEWHKGSGARSVSEKTISFPTPLPVSHSGPSLSLSPDKPRSCQTTRVSHPYRLPSSTEMITSSVLDNDNRSTHGEPLNSSRSSTQEFFAEDTAEDQLDRRIDAMLTIVAPTSSCQTDEARKERLYTQQAYMTRSPSRFSFGHRRTLNTALDLHLSPYCYRPSPTKTRIAHVQTHTASKYYPGPVGSPQKLAQILGKEVLGPVQKPTTELNEEHDQMVRRVLGFRAESRMSERRGLTGIEEVRRGLRRILG